MHFIHIFIYNFNIALHKLVDNIANHLFVARNRSCRYDNIIIRRSGNLSVLAVCDFCERTHRFALRTRGNYNKLIVGIILNVVYAYKNIIRHIQIIEFFADLHQIFKADVGRHMGLTADPQLWGEAQLLLAQPARELGLVTDIVRDRDAAIRKLAVEAQMTREELAAQSPELVDALLAEGRLKAEAENKANMDKAAADAVAGALAVVKAVAGDETASHVETTLNTLRATGMSAEQIATVAPLLAKAEAPVHENAEAKSRADILAGLQAAHRQPAAAAPGTVPTATTKSPLLADAERRAELAK